MTQLEQLQQQYQDLKEELDIIRLIKLEDYADIMAYRQESTDEFKELVRREYVTWQQSEALRKQIKKIEPKKPVYKSAFKRYNPREYYS